MDWLLSLLSLEQVQSLFGDAMRSEISGKTVAFLIAWQLVKRDMRKGLKAEFAKITDAIESVGLGLAKLNTRVEILENKHLQGGKDGVGK